MSAAEPTRSFAPETAPQAGKTLLQLSVVRTRHAAIEDGVPCRGPKQRFSANRNGLLRIVSGSNERAGSASRE
jgi:hypothetical protein